jgi:deazaflavin-dependent oxidoreductase (nitroreductase family)
MTEIDREQLLTDTGALHAFNDDIVTKFRANGGEVAEFGGHLLLLTTTGAKSGQPRLSPLAYLAIDGRTIIFGSYGGAPKDPAWVHNLRADSRAHIEVGTESYDVTARELVADERAQVLSAVVAQAPVLADYQAKTTRLIPLFDLVRV